MGLTNQSLNFNVFFFVFFQALVGELQQDQLRTILLATVEKTPDVLWDILDCGQFDGQRQETVETHLSEESCPPGSPSPDPRSQFPSWCVCGNCEEMPTEEERVCCGKEPNYCLSTLPVFSLFDLILYTPVKIL